MERAFGANLPWVDILSWTDARRRLSKRASAPRGRDGPRTWLHDKNLQNEYSLFEDNI